MVTAAASAQVSASSPQRETLLRQLETNQLDIDATLEELSVQQETEDQNYGMYATQGALRLGPCRVSTLPGSMLVRQEGQCHRSCRPVGLGDVCSSKNPGNGVQVPQEGGESGPAVPQACSPSVPGSGSLLLMSVMKYSKTSPHLAQVD